MFDIQLVHLMTLGTAPYADEATSSHVRHNAFFIGANVRNAVRSGMADYTPCRLFDIPTFFRTQRTYRFTCTFSQYFDVREYVVMHVIPRPPNLTHRKFSSTCGLLTLQDPR